MRKSIPVNVPLGTPKDGIPKDTPPKDSTPSDAIAASDAPASLPVAQSPQALPDGQGQAAREQVGPGADEQGQLPDGRGAARGAGKVPPAEILEVDIKDKKQLQGVYMPFLTNGGIFLPTAREYALGEEVHLKLSLMKESRQYTVTGRVAWITPRNALNKRIQGIGVHFSLDENTGITKRKIEELLGTAVKSDKSTYTL